MAFLTGLLKNTAAQTERVNEISAEQQMEEIKWIEILRSRTSLKENLTKASTTSVLNLQRPLTAARSPPRSPTLKNVKNCPWDSKNIFFLLKRLNTVGVRSKNTTTWSSRWFWRRKLHLHCWETRPCSYIFSKEEKDLLRSAGRFCLQVPNPNSVLPARHCQSRFLPHRPNIGICFACGKTAHVCCPAMTKQSGSPTSKWLDERDLSRVVPVLFWL